MDDEVVKRAHFEVHEGIVFAIELTKNLLTQDPNTGFAPIEEIMEAILDSMRHSIITLPNTGYGCYFFNSAETSEGCKKGIQKLFGLTDLNFENMKIVQDILEEAKEPIEGSSRPYVPLEQRFKNLSTAAQDAEDDSEDSGLYDVLVTLQDEFLIKKDFQKQYNNKKIFLFTDNDHPLKNPNSTQERNVLRRLFSDLDDAFINIVPFFISHSYKEFNPKIYSELLLLDQPKQEDGEINIFDGPNTEPISASFIKNRVLRRKEIKRIQFQCPFVFKENELVIGLKGYAIYTHEKSARNKYVYETENYRKNVYTKRRFVNERTGAEFDKTAKFYAFGSDPNDNIKLTDEQIDELNKYDDKYDSFIRLLGFKTRKFAEKLHYNTSKSPFVIPDEDRYEGSTRTLSALYQSLVKKDKVAVVFGKIRKGAQPSVYSLVPTIKSEGFPEGFILVRLPFIDDIRKIPEGYDYYNDAPVDWRKVTTFLLRNLKLKNGYKPSEFKNPSLQWHYKILHDYLLQVEMEDESVLSEIAKGERKLENDDTLKKVHQVRQRVEQAQLKALDDEGYPGKINLFLLIRQWNSYYNRV